MSERAYIATVLVVRSDGTRIYTPSNGMTAGQTEFVDRSCPPLTRPEVCRKYKSVPVIDANQTRERIYRMQSHKIPAIMPHYRLEEI